MRPFLGGISGLVLVLAFAVPRAVEAQETRIVSGIVVDADSGAPVTGALVTIRGTGLSVVTDPDGRFEVAGVPVGSLELVLRHVAYGEHAEPLDVEASGSLNFEIRVSTRAIELAPLGVEVRSSEAQAQRASGTATNVIDRATIEAFIPGGQGLLPLLRGRIPSLRIDTNCVEYRVFQRADVRDPENPEWLNSTGCRDITVYMDGVPDRDGSALLRQLSPEDVERIQVLSPAEAGLRYMNGNRGVVLIETRRGVVADTRERVHISGFAWRDPQPYPWLRVLGASVLGNAVVAGVTSRTAFDCGSQEPGLTPIRCQAPAGIAGAVLTTAIGRAITHRAGRTPYTEGRALPAFLLGAATASVGYMLYVQGETQNSDASRTAGQIVLAVGVPISLVFSDRVFRMLR